MNRTFKMITFEASFKLKPQQVLDFVPFPLRTQECDDGEAFADHIRGVHEKVMVP